MTDLEKAVASDLRMSDKAAEKLLPVIQRNIKTARLELIRTGVSSVLANSTNVLIEDAIISFCLYKMDDASMREKHWDAFVYQCDNLRKSTIKLEGEEENEE